MTTYGNKIWNDATDNKEKSLIFMSNDEFQRLHDRFESSGINYLAYSKDGTTIMAVNDMNIDWLKQIIGNDNIDIRKSSIVHTPPDKNIIGNIEYRYIPQKEYISTDRDTALKMAELMQKQNIKFSGRIYPNGKAALTVSRTDLERTKAVQQTVIDMRKQFEPKENEQENTREVIGNTEYRDIRQRQYIFSKLTQEQYRDIKPFLDENARYSGVIRNGKITFTVEKDDYANFNALLENTENILENEKNTAEVTKSANKSSIHFGLFGNGVTAYDVSRTDKETDDYVTVAHISPEGIVKIYDDTISAEDVARIKNEAVSVREDFIENFNSLDTMSQFQKLYNRADAKTMVNMNNDNISIEDKIEKYMPFIFFGEGERPKPDISKERKELGSVSMRKVGDFYEMYGENAETAADILGLTLMTKGGEDMVGFPDYVKDEYSEKLINAGYTVITEDAIMDIPDMNTPDSKHQEENEQDIDKRLFDDISVIEEIESREHAIDSKPFWEEPEISGEQLGLFGDTVSERKTEIYNENNSNLTLTPLDSKLETPETVISVYHGTTSDFDKFKYDYHGAVWTTADFEDAKRFAGNLEDSKVFKVTASLENPVRLEYGISENWDIDKSIFDAKADGHDSVIIDFKFTSAENDFYKFSLENSPDAPAKKILNTIVDAMGVSAFVPDNETISEFDRRMRENNNTVHSYIAVLDSDKLEITEKISVYEKNENKEISEITLNPLESKLEQDSNTVDKSEIFTITDNALGEGGAKTKFKNNIAAIEMLKTLENENRPATAEEKEILSKYVGWGGIAQAFDKDNKSWENEYNQLKELLTDKEYTSARSSTLDAFYTTPLVIDGIYKAIENFGFKGGNILEPAMGVGNFFGRMPEDIRTNSNLYGVEIDSISGRIAQKIYPYADISIHGFEKNKFQDGCFDLAVGNVPFGELGFNDITHGTNKLHDYFFAETIYKVKSGGVIAFVTSAGTLDKQNEAVRKQLAENADLIGAIRLPNTAFKHNANTEVTTDIIFLQKRTELRDLEQDIPDWVHIGETADGLPINKYYEQNPDMVLGKMVEGNKLYNGRSDGTMCVPFEDSDLKELLNTAVSKLSATISDEKTKDVYAKSADGNIIDIPENLRNYSFFEQDKKIYFKKSNSYCKLCYDSKNSQYKRINAFIELRDTTRELIEAQELNKPDNVIKDLQTKLNTAYDTFYEKFGLIHSKTNKRYFGDDVSYNLVAGLEKKYEKNELKEKSDIFTKRTICPPKAVEHVETAIEALTLSIAEKTKVDFMYMSNLTGMTEDELKKDLTGEIFKVPHTQNEYQTASEYLSGDIREKLKTAEEIAEYDADFNINVNALKAAMPPPLKVGDIDIRIGATWLDPKYYEQFMYELFRTPKDNRNDVIHSPFKKPKVITAEFSKHTCSWHINNKSWDWSVIVSQQYGSKKMSAYEIMEHLLNLKEPKVYKTVEESDGLGGVKEKRVVDIDATKVVQRKADKIKAEFKKWIFKDSTRREEIVSKYNELFNSVKPREYDGSALKFPMMNSDIKLHDHQKNAIAHAMFGGNTLFAHCVGAGKTFEMIATAMESKRLGLCTKSMFAVPNHLTEQIGDDFQKLYPSANVLVATKKDFKKENRQQLFAKIATGNYDAVIVGHSQLGMIPISKERQEMEIQSQINDIIEGIAELKEQDGSNFQVKAMERTKKSLEKQLQKLEKKHDDTITFEQLGIDKLFVDEAHEFKNLFCATKLNNISGISNSASQKALDLYMKCRYLDEKTGGKGVTFATGTPVDTP